MKIIRKKLSPDEINPSASAYYDDCECYKTIPPGGGTPYENPAADPRSNAWALLPPRTGGDPQCDAAANMIVKLKSMVAQAIGGLDQFQIATGFLEALLVVFGAVTGGLGDLLIAGGEIFITIGVDAISSAFTDDQWQLILCILACNTDPDGQVSAVAVDTILAQIHVQCDPVVYDVMFFCIGTLGWVGLSNAGATGTETGDCSGCDCDMCAPKIEPFTDAPQAFTTIADTSYTPTNTGRYGGVFSATGGRTTGYAQGNSLAPFTDATQVTVTIDMGLNCNVGPVTMYWRAGGELLNLYISYFAEDGTYLGNFGTTLNGTGSWESFSNTGGTSGVRYITFAVVCDPGDSLCGIDDISVAIF